MLGALRHRNYRLFFTGQVISQVGTWMQSIALPWLVLLRGGRIMAQGATADVLTPENVRALYEVEADVQFHHRAGRLMVVPIARSH